MQVLAFAASNGIIRKQHQTTQEPARTTESAVKGSILRDREVEGTPTWLGLTGFPETPNRQLRALSGGSIIIWPSIIPWEVEAQ